MRPIIVREGRIKLFCVPKGHNASSRPHAFAMCPDGRVRVWLTPQVELDGEFRTRLSEQQLLDIKRLVQKNLAKLLAAWE